MKTEEVSQTLIDNFSSQVPSSKVSFGQTIYLPRNPKCNICPIIEYCDKYKAVK